MKTYLVGGAVRDEIMGHKSKDLDYTVVLNDDERELIHQRMQSPFDYMANTLVDKGYKIFVETPEHFTIRAQTPDRKETADFVLARKEGPYSDGRRPDFVEVGTLLDDLSRRDFSINAIAKDTDGPLIDPFNGVQDIQNKIIRAVGDPFARFDEDALRMLRAVRFKVTKGFNLHHDIIQALHNEVLLRKLALVSDERKREELNKMFKHDTLRSLNVLEAYRDLRDVVFSGSVNLEATMKTKGRKK